MVTVSVSQLKARLSEHLRRVKAGEEVIVTDRGHPVAVLGPPPKPIADQARLQRLAARGLVKIGAGIRPDFFERPKRKRPKASIVALLLEEREEGR